MHKGRK